MIKSVGVVARLVPPRVRRRQLGRDQACHRAGRLRRARHELTLATHDQAVLAYPGSFLAIR